MSEADDPKLLSEIHHGEQYICRQASRNRYQTHHPLGRSGVGRLYTAKKSGVVSSPETIKQRPNHRNHRGCQTKGLGWDARLPTRDGGPGFTNGPHGRKGLNSGTVDGRSFQWYCNRSSFATTNGNRKAK